MSHILTHTTGFLSKQFNKSGFSFKNRLFSAYFSSFKPIAILSFFHKKYI